MKKILACALMFFIIGLAGCKKSEQEQQSKAPVNKPENFRPQKKKKPAEPGTEKKAAGPAALEVYSEKNLVKSIPQSEFPTLTTTKVKAGNKDVQAIPMKDLLAKYNVKGKNVVLTGEERSVPLTWEQANSGDLYLILTPKGRLKVFSTNKQLTAMKLPKRIDSITVGSTTQAATSTAQSKPTS